MPAAHRHRLLLVHRQQTRLKYARRHSALEYLKDTSIHGFPFFCLLVDFFLNFVPFETRNLLFVSLVALISVSYTHLTLPTILLV